MAKEWMWLAAPAAAPVSRRPPTRLLSFPLLLLPLVLPPWKKETLLGAQRRVMFRGILVNITGISVGAPGILGRLQEGLEGVVAETQLTPGGQSAGLARRGTCGAAQVAGALENNTERVSERAWLARATETVSWGTEYWVGRVLSFFPVVGIWTPPTPHPQASVPPPFGSGGRGTLAGERVGGRVGESRLRRGDIHCGTCKYMYFVSWGEERQFRKIR